MTAQDAGEQAPHAAGWYHEISLTQVIATALRRWLLILATVVAAVLFTLNWLSGQSPVYSGIMLISPAPDMVGGGGGGGGGATGGGGAVSSLATALGLRPNSNAINNFDRYQLTMTSTALARVLDEKYDLLHRIYGSQWDAASKTWVKPKPGFVGRMKEAFLERYGIPTWSPPTPQSLAGFLSSSLLVSPLEGFSVVRSVEFRHGDPAFIRELLALVDIEAENLLRQSMLAESKRKIDYLNDKIRDVKNIQLQASMTDQLAQEERSVMYLQAGVRIGAQVLEGPKVAPTPISPKPIFALGVAVFGGFLLGLMLALALEFILGSRTRSSRPWWSLPRRRK